MAQNPKIFDPTYYKIIIFVKDFMVRTTIVAALIINKRRVAKAASHTDATRNISLIERRSNHLLPFVYCHYL